MKSFILLFFIFISIISIHAQEKDYKINEIKLYDFCHCDYSHTAAAEYMMRRKSSYIELINSQKRIKLETLYNSKTMVSIKFSLNDNSHIEEEYIRLETDTFHYAKYDHSDDHNVLAEGNYYFDKSNILIDSSHQYHLDLDDKHKIGESNVYYLYQKVKHGFWMEKDSTTIHVGYYNHGKREGIWMLHGFKLSKKEVLYKNGIILQEEELNLIRKEDNLQELEDILINGTWRRYSGLSSPTLQKSKQSNIQFFKDFTYKSRIPPHATKTGKWRILLRQKILIIDHWHYNIDWFSSDMIQLFL